MSSNVEQHYDGVTMATREQRAKGRLYDMKKFHNLMKRNLLRTFATLQERVLDLGCGRGGDIEKWKEYGELVYDESAAFETLF